MEVLEARALLSAPVKINFQPAGAAVPAGYLPDSGATYADRGNGYSYGWNQANGTTRDRNALADQRYDTLVHLSYGSTKWVWALGVPNGVYDVRVVAGDPSFADSTYAIDVEGVPVISGKPTRNGQFFDQTVTVVVSDGRITLSNGAGMVNNKLSFVEVTARAPAAAAPLAAPTDLVVTAAANVPRMTLSWADNAVGESGYAIERSGDGVTYTQIAQVGAGVTGYSDPTGLAAGTWYTYRVRATGAGGGSAASLAARARTASFHLYDTTQFRGKPNLAWTGMEHLYVAYANELAPPGGAWTYDQPDEKATRLAARRAAANADIMVIDIEHWPRDISVPWVTRSAVQGTIDKFARIIGWIRAERPGLKVGIYGLFPLPDYGTLAFGDAAPRADVQAANEFLRPLADRVDVIFPELYAPDLNGRDWTRYAQAMVGQARRYGKPVVPFLWHRTLDDRTAIPEELFRLQLTTVRQVADGAVIWGGVSAAGIPEPWSETDGWWRATRGFVTDPATAAVPAAPAGLTAASSTSGIVDLSWADRSPSESGFVIERSSDGVTYAPIAVVGPNTTSYRDTGLTGTSYVYRVRSQSTPGVSAATAPARVRVVHTGLPRIEAEQMDGMSGRHYVGPSYVSAWTEGGWFRYTGLDFGTGARSVTASVNVSVPGKRFELRLDSPTGALVGTFDARPTSGAYQAQTVTVSGVLGVHDLYLVFKTAWFGNIERFHFNP